jgi:hypothetical protein
MVFLASVLVYVLLFGERGSCFQLFRSATKKTPENSSLPSVATATRPVAKIDPHPPQEYDKQAWKSGFTTCKQEVCCEIGQGLPSDLRGTYYRYFQFVIIAPSTFLRFLLNDKYVLV